MLISERCTHPATDRSSDRQHPLCVDLDGTLIHGDLLWEGIAVLLSRNPLNALLMILWLFKGRANLKARIASHVNVDPVTLPYHESFISYLKEQHRANRVLILVTASNAAAAAPIMRHLGLFSGMIASDERRNVKGDRKRAVLEERFGPRGYDYAGNSRADLAVWEGCRQAIVVNGSRRLERKAADVSIIEQTFRKHRCVWVALARAIRVHQWIKNLLVFLPIVAAHRIFEIEVWAASAIAFAAFCFCASSVYILNDLLDLSSDRAHATKRSRPFASGSLSIPFGFALMVVLAASSVAISSLLSREFQVTLLAYYLLTLAYSFSLKRKLMIDVVVLSGLYALRVVGGGTATGIELSPWFLAFFVFLFFSLALIKRFVELRNLVGAGVTKELGGRRYTGEDIHIIAALGASSGFMSALVLALYINSPQVSTLYRAPFILWFLCPLILYWISRIWVMANRGYVDGDPVLFAMTDKVTCATAVLGGGILALASHGLHFMGLK